MKIGSLKITKLKPLQIESLKYKKYNINFKNSKGVCTYLFVFYSFREKLKAIK